MSVYIALQNSICERNNNQDKTVAVQKCGNPPYEISLRFAGCNLKCGPCFASGYSWANKYQKSKRVKNNINLQRLIDDYDKIPKDRIYNWMRILGGEPLLNEEYVNYLFEFILKIAQKDTSCFRNGIIIQTNGIYIGLKGVDLIESYLKEIYKINSNLKIVIEISIKGTNPEEFALLTQSSKNLFGANIQAYFNLKTITLPNFRPTVIAGFGISESLLLTGGRSPKSIMTILFDNETPIFHPDIWSSEFSNLYKVFTKDWGAINQIFRKMPMYGIKDEFNYTWVKYALKQAKKLYGNNFYDSDYTARNSRIKEKIMDILDYFFLLSNQEYYSELINA